MGQMYKISIIVVMMIFISGCVGTEKIKSGNESTGIIGEKNIEQKSPQKSLMELGHFVDPKLNNIKIENSNSNIEIVRFEIEDKRDYEKSENFGLRILVSNNGNVPVYINGYVKFSNKDTAPPESYIFLKSGERTWLEVYDGRTANMEYYTLDRLNTLIIAQQETVIPTISPEFRNYKNFSMRRHNTVNYYPSPFIDFYSMKYEETVEKWRYAIIGIMRKNKGGQIDISLIGKDGNLIANRFENVNNSAKIEYIKIPLKNFFAEDIYEVRMNSLPPQQ